MAENDETPWYGEIQDQEVSDWAQNKNFESGEVAMSSYRNLEQMVGAEKAGKTVIIPDDTGDAAKMNTFYNKLGRPETSDNYEFDLPDNADKDFVGWFKTNAHEAGLSSSQAATLVKSYNEMQGGRAQADTDAATLKATESNDALKTEWGAAYDTNMAQAQAAAKQFGFTEDEINGMENMLGYAGTIQKFQQIGAKLGEANFVNPDLSNPNFAGAMSPGDALTRISELQSDKDWTAKYLQGSKSHVTTMDNLQKMAIVSG